MPPPDPQLGALVHSIGGSQPFSELVGRLATGLPEAVPAPLCLISGCSCLLAGAAAWLARSQADALLLPAERLSPEMERRLLDRGYLLANLDEGWTTPPQRPSTPRPGRITLLTSGTTGDPKVVEHTWESLFTMPKVRNAPASNWLVTYQPGTYAWWQMLTMALFVPGQNLSVSDDRSPQALIRTALSCQVTAISSTPTFWRMVFLLCPPDDLQRLALRQITLGGERVDQPILDRLQAAFPAASLTHIYATSEAGAAIVVRDGKEGFPASWLNHSDDDRPRLDVREGMLYVQSRFASSTGWICTGDRCERRGDRIIILGRDDTGFINVGGAKAPAHEIERVLLEHPGVLWARVGSRKAPFLGELVAAEIVPQPAAPPPAEAELAAFCTQRLPDYMIPRFWSFLDSIPATSNLKTKIERPQ